MVEYFAKRNKDVLFFHGSQLVSPSLKTASILDELGPTAIFM